jgi:hypothetical protein
MNIKPRESKYIEECTQPIALKHITEFKIDDNTGAFITGESGTGRTYKCNELQQELLNKGDVCYKVCTPTHKSSLIANAITIFNLFNINPTDYTYIKTTVEKLKSDGIKWIFIDNISIKSSKIWSVIRNEYIWLQLFGYFINYQV